MSPVSNPNQILKKEKKIKGQAVQEGKSDNPLSHFFKPLAASSSNFVSSTAVTFSVVPNTTVIMAGGGGANLTQMEQILANRYAPLVLVLPLSQIPVGDYQKYMPKFFGPGNYTAEEHLEAFYAYAENINIEAQDVWMRILSRAWMEKPENGLKRCQLLP